MKGPALLQLSFLLHVDDEDALAELLRVIDSTARRSMEVVLAKAELEGNAREEVLAAVQQYSATLSFPQEMSK